LCGFLIQGGETHALKFFMKRIHSEKEAFLDGSFLPNRRDPDILNPPKSLSPDLKVLVHKVSRSKVISSFFIDIFYVIIVFKIHEIIYLRKRQYITGDIQ
jgi:hypothetical protein